MQQKVATIWDEIAATALMLARISRGVHASAAEQVTGRLVGSARAVKNSMGRVGLGMAMLSSHVHTCAGPRASATEQAVGRLVGSMCAVTARDGDAQSAMLASWISQARRRSIYLILLSAVWWWLAYLCWLSCVVFISREAKSSTRFPCVAIVRLRNNVSGCKMISLSRRTSQGNFNSAGPAARVRVRVVRSIEACVQFGPSSHVLL